MDTKQTARSAMAINPELVQSFIDNARAAGLGEDQIDSLLDMDIAELQAKSEQLKDLKEQGTTHSTTED
jgi:hypothetical protein